LQYGVVLDAGSSHTTVFIYKWPADKENGTGIVTQHKECHVEGGGISSYAEQLGGAGRSLVKCLDQVVQDIPKRRHAQTPVYLGATAGMRLLKKTSPRQTARVLQEVNETLAAYPFDFRGSEILSGQLEGAYGWVTVNYLLENFIKYGFVGRWLNPGRDTVGALDLGGASTQITFATKEVLEDKKNSLSLRLYGQQYQLYTHSFLCYGRDQVLRKVHAQVIKDQGYSKEVSHPCMPAGMVRNLTLAEVFDSPCTTDQQPRPYRPQERVLLIGTGSYERCRANVSRIFSFGNCNFSRCSFDGVYQPPVTGNFMAFSAFFYTHSFLLRTTEILVNSPDQLDRATRRVCNMTAEEMVVKAPDQKRRLQDYCAVSVFIQLLTLNGYGFNSSTFSHISFQKKAGDTSVGWALGYMLSLSSLLPGESLGIRKALRPGAWGGLLFLLSLLLLLALVLLMQHLSRKNKGDGTVI
ncbi:ENTP2 diphosphohydrolase, partial [Amia calva]|nr:ENTP2 diphosphohydrolase [Amia calva]